MGVPQRNQLVYGKALLRVELRAGRGIPQHSLEAQHDFHIAHVIDVDELRHAASVGNACSTFAGTPEMRVRHSFWSDIYDNAATAHTDTQTSWLKTLVAPVRDCSPPVAMAQAAGAAAAAACCTSDGPAAAPADSASVGGQLK